MRSVVAVLLLCGAASGQFAERGAGRQSGSWQTGVVPGVSATSLNAYCTPTGSWIGAATDGVAALPQTCNYTAAAATPTANWRAVCPGSSNANASPDGKCWVGNAGDVIPTSFARAGQAVDYTSVQSAMTNAAGHCGIWFNVLPTSNNTPSGTARIYDEAVTIPGNTTCNASNWNWVTTGNYAGLPDENTRITPGWMGIAALQGRPAYARPAQSGVYVPRVRAGVADTGAITLDASTAYWRFAGLELTQKNGVRNTGPVIDLPGGAYGQVDVTPCTGTDVPVTGCSSGNTAGYYVLGTGNGFSGAVGKNGTSISVNNYRTAVVSSPDSNHVVLSGSLAGMFPPFTGRVNTTPCTAVDTPVTGCVAGGTWVQRQSGDSFGGSGTQRWSWSNNIGQMYVAINGAHNGGNIYKIVDNGVLDGDNLIVTANAGTQTGASYYLPPAFNANPGGPDHIVYDRLLIHGGDDAQWQNMAAVSGVGILAKGTNITVQNSYIADLWCSSGSVSFGVSGANYAGTTTTLNVASTYGYAPNQSLTVSGMTPTTYNGTFTIAAVDTGAGTISYAQGANPGTFATGGTAKVVLSQCQEAKAVSTGSAVAPIQTIKVVNNFLESSGENIFLGGGTSGGPATDVEVRRNHLYKPLLWNKFCVNPGTGTVNTSGGTVTRASGIFFRPEWVGSALTISGVSYTVTAVASQSSMTVNPAPGTLSGVGLTVNLLPEYCQGIPYLGINMDIKNNFEAKEGVRMLIEGNILEGNWEGQSDQFGEILHLNVMQNTNNALPGSTLSDASVRYNLLVHGNKGMVLANAGYAAGPLPGGVGRFAIHDNLFDDINNTKWGLSASGQPQVGATCVVTNNALSGAWSIHDISVNHNTCVQSSAGGIPVGSESGSLWGWSDFTNATPAMSGTVNTALDASGWWAVNLVSGSQFPIDGTLVGQEIQVNGQWYQVAFVRSSTQLFLFPSENVGAHSGVSWWSQCQSGTCTNENATPAWYWPGMSFTNNVATGGISPAFSDGSNNGAANAVAMNSGTTGWCFGPNLIPRAVLWNQQANGYPGSQGGSACPAFGVGNLNTSDQTYSTAGFTAYSDGDFSRLAGGNNDYALTSSSPGHGTASDGKDLGADMTAVASYTNGVQ